MQVFGICGETGDNTKLQMTSEAKLVRVAPTLTGDAEQILLFQDKSMDDQIQLRDQVEAQGKGYCASVCLCAQMCITNTEKGIHKEIKTDLRYRVTFNLQENRF